MTVPLPSFEHLLAISDEFGTFEHADGAVPRLEHGYCADDVARVLVVVAREPNPTREVAALGHTSLRFLADAQGVGGKVRNRRTAQGRWEGRRGVDDCWGRSIWAWGTAVNRDGTSGVGERAQHCFDRAVALRSRSPRAMAFAALGAAEVLVTDADHLPARRLLADTVTTIGPLGAHDGWPWPEPRLAYANAALAEALVAAGDLLHRPEVLDDGLALLGWLLERETVDGHLSLTPVGGAGPLDRAPRFDQQPIEVAAMADACVRAAAVTGGARWLDGLDSAVRWFTGDNDAGAVMGDPATGGGYDGLHARGANLNQGAESTLALISTLQHARRSVPVPA